MSFPAYPEYKDSGVPWLCAVPASWSVERFRHVFRESGEKIESEVVGPMLSVSGYRGIEVKEYDDENRRRLDEELIGYRIVRRGQLVVNTMWLNYAGLGVSDHEGHVSPAYRSYWIERDVDRRYIHHLMRSTIYVQGYTRLLTGIRPNSLQMSRDDLMDFPVVVPPRVEQSAIAAFLDRETAKIDALVAEQEHLIALLKEKRQAVISHAVTKGLNPHAPMKDSGIEWLGEVPAHWEVAPVKRSISLATSGPRGWSDLESESGSVFFQSQNIGRDMEAIFTESKRIEAPEGPDAERARLRSDDVAVCITGGRTGSVGHISHLSEDAYVNQHVCLLRPSPNRTVGRYLAYGLFGLPGQEQLSLAMYGLKQGLSLENVCEVVLPLPPMDEQALIVEHLDELAMRVTGLVQEAQSAITLLQERRAALISAAVTGKIDVRGEVISSNVVALESARPDRASPALSAIVGTYAIRELGPMGRMAVMKAGYLAEAYAGLPDLNGRYERYAAGPYDHVLLSAMERGASEFSGIITHEPRSAGDAVTYQVPSTATAPFDALRIAVGEETAERFRSMLSLLKGIGRDGVEAVATIYAVWNDLLADKKDASDDMICRGVLTDWHPEKANKFKRSDLDHWLGWMRRQGFTPDGTAPRTDHQGSLF